MCSASRGDFALTGLAFNSAVALRPEEALLVTEWFNVAVEKSLPGVATPVAAEKCNPALVCWFLGQEPDESQALSKFARALGSLDQGSFYQARASALDRAKTWDEGNVPWKLTTALGAVFESPPPRATKEETQSKSSTLWDAWSAENAGYSRLSRITLAQATNRAHAVLQAGNLTLLSTSPAAQTLAAVRAGYPQKTPARSVATQKPRTTQAQQDLTRSPHHIVLTTNGSSFAHGAASFAPASDPHVSELLLATLLTRWTRRGTGHVRAWLERSSGLYRTPHLRLMGPLEGVQTGLTELSDIALETQSASGALTAPEIAAFEGSSRLGALSDPRCFEPPKDLNEAGSRPDTMSLGALSTALWGARESVPAEEL